MPTYIRAHAPGADSIEVEIGTAPGYGRTFLDPMQLAQRTFMSWACIGVLDLAAVVATGSMLPLVFLPVPVMIMTRSSYEAFRVRHGVWGLAAAGVWLTSPGDWWPIHAGDDGQPVPSPVASKTTSSSSCKAPGVPLACRLALARHTAGNAWYRLRQVPRRLYCKAFGRPVPAPAGTPRLTYEPRNRAVL